MAIRILPNVSPRIVVIQKPDNNRSIQVLTGEIKGLEDEPAYLTFPAFVSTGGKENLGGGTSVGITATLLNTIVAFEQRGISVSQGTVTTTSSKRLIDSFATFITDGVEAGASIVNFTDRSVGTVIRVISETEIELLSPLEDGATNTFSLNDEYRIWNIEQVSVDGGNLVAIDALRVGTGNTISPILPTFGTQVLLTSSSSATLQEAQLVEYGAFGRRVTIDAINGISGTGKNIEGLPIGTERDPVNNIPDAIVIAQQYGIGTLFFKSDYVFDTGDVLTGYNIIGEGEEDTTLTFNAGSDVASVKVSQATVTGSFDDRATFRNCHLENISFVEADIQDCTLFGIITLSGTGDTIIVDCKDGLVADSPPPAIDMGGAGRGLAIRNYFGDISLRNKTGGENVEINVNSGGRITLENTVSNGNIRITGTAALTDNSTGTAVIDTTDLIFPDQLQRSSFGDIVRYSPNGTAGIKYPQGTAGNEINNIQDVLLVAAANNINQIQVDQTLIIPSGVDISSYRFIGKNELNSIVVLQSGCITERTNFFSCIITGVVNGSIYAKECGLETLSNIGADTFPSILFQCIFRSGTHTFRNGLTTPQNIHFIHCESGVPGVGAAILNINGSDSPIAFRGYEGGVVIDNMTAGNICTFGFAEGQLTLNPSCISGTIQLDGVVNLVDNSNGVVVNKRSAVSKDIVADSVWDELASDHSIAGSFGEAITVAKKILRNRQRVDRTTRTLTIYDDDGTTPLFVFDLRDAAGGTNITPDSDQGIFDRDPQ